ncbi:adenylate/guanylate cyclase domain-containing protein [Treponema sp.]|uniref:adenylate/guanylate cyclase domain-containing protein n=1 Tax=Treponema sp. TaxID=166 RepID=UPI003F04FC94
MKRRILILEQSDAVQSVFSKHLQEYDCAFFSDDDIECVVKKIISFVPELVLVNSFFGVSSGFSTVRMLREIPYFASVKMRVYSCTKNCFDRYYAASSGAEFFTCLTEPSLEKNIEELLKLPEEPSVQEQTVKKGSEFLEKNQAHCAGAAAWWDDISKRAVLDSIFKLIQPDTNVPSAAEKYLNMIAQICRAPASALFIKSDGKIRCFAVCAQQADKKETDDFLSVAKADYEAECLDGKNCAVVPEFLSADKTFEQFCTPSLPFSACHYAVLKDSQGNKIGTVHSVACSKFRREQITLFDYAAKKAGAIFQMILAFEKKIFFERNIRKAFNRFVPEQIIDDLVKSAGNGENVSAGEKRRVAVLFSDIRSFTNISEVNKPEVLVDFLNRYFTIMVDIIKKYGGTVDKFIGDAIMALFGSPVSYVDNARRAVAAAYEMRRALPSVPLGNLVLPEQMKFNIGIGIHYGDVIAGSIGSKDKTDYTVIGDSVNLASRLEGLTKTYGTQVLVSDAVRAEFSDDEFEFRYLDDVKVKGKKESVAIFAVDRSPEEFSAAYKDNYKKGTDLYKQGLWNLALHYFSACLSEYPDDKASALMLSRCNDFIENPPENWDGAVAFTAK